MLGLTLTSRDKTVPMAGFPHHPLETYLRKLLHAGHRVAVCDQVEDAALAKGLVKREVTRVVTPGTLTEDDLLDPRQANHLVAVWPPRHATASAWPGSSCPPGSFSAADVPLRPAGRRAGPAGARRSACAPRATPTPSRRALLERLPRPPALTHAGPTGPSTRDRARPRCSSTSASPRWPASASTTTSRAWPPPARCCSTCRRRSRPSLAPPAPAAALSPASSTCLLDEVTRRSLELTRTLRDGSRDGSLLSAIDRTVTPMGARLLHDWLLAPLADRAAIEARLDAVAELLDEHALRARPARQPRRDVYDLQRLTARVSTGRASPRDLAAVGRTLRLLPRLKAKLTAATAALLRELEARLELCPDLREALDAALVDDPPLSAARRRHHPAAATTPTSTSCAQIATRRQGVDRPLPGRGDHAAPASPA